MTLVTRQSIVDDDGTFTFGTVGDVTFFSSFYDEIDDQCHSTTNPTVKPKAITDEVVAARGSKASVDARLDVALNDDGTLKTQSSLIAASTYQAGLGSRNVVLNGDLDAWTAGGAAAPDSFTLTGGGATIARTGIAQADTFHFGTGSGFAAKVTRAGTDWKLTQDVISAADFAKYVNVKSQKVSVAVKGKTAIASYLRIVVDDGVTTTASSYHTGGGTEEHLSVTHTISNSATKLSVYVEGTGSNGDGYVGGFVIVFADLAPTDWQALSTINDASSTVKGLVTTGAQTFAGAKTFAAAPVFQALPTGLSGILFSRATGDFTKNNNVTLGDVTGLSFAIGANEVWTFRFSMKAVSAGAADFKFAVTGPAAPTAVIYGVINANASIGTSAAAAFGTAVSTGSGAAEEWVVVEGVVRNGANAGTIQLQFAQNTLNVSDSIIRAESFVVAHHVA